MALRIAYVTDIHYGPDIGAKKGSQAGKLLDRFVDAANSLQADYIITGGDDISSRDPESDEKNALSVSKHFERATCPVIKVKGNHCGRFKLRQSLSQIIDAGEHQIIIWNPYLNRYSGEGIAPDPEDITWLEISLAAVAKPAILFTHIPPNGPEASKKWKQKSSGDVYYPNNFVNEERIQSIIESSGKVISCHSGHRHCNFHQESNGIHYLVHQSLVEDVDKSGQGCGAFSLLEFDSDVLRIHGHGIKQPQLKTLPITKPQSLVIA